MQKSTECGGWRGQSRVSSHVNSEQNDSTLGSCQGASPPLPPHNPRRQRNLHAHYVCCNIILLLNFFRMYSFSRLFILLSWCVKKNSEHVFKKRTRSACNIGRLLNSLRKWCGWLRNDRFGNHNCWENKRGSHPGISFSSALNHADNFYYDMKFLKTA